MPSKTFGRNKSTLLAKTGSTSLGGGHDSHLPVGTSGSYDLRGAVQFNLDWTGVTGITSAILNMQNSSFTHIDVGGTIKIRRITSGSWTPNSGRSSLDSGGGSGWSTSGDATFDDIGAGTSSGEVIKNTPGGNGDSWTADITDIVKAWAPTSIPGGGGQPNYGIVLVVDSGDAEMKSGYDNSDPYITLNYTSNVVPSAPTLTAPVNGSVVATTPTFTFTHVDSDGDALLDWDLQIVDMDEGDPPVWALAEVNLAAQTGGISGNNVSRTYSDLGFSAQRGHTYSWRARTSASTGELGEGAWSAVYTFTVASLPTATVTTPAAGHTAKLSYTAGANTVPQIVVEWDYADADGHTQTSVAIKVYSDSGGSPGAQFGTTYTYTGAAETAIIPLANVTPVEGDKYHISVTPTCSFPVTGSESTKNITRTRWGRASYYYNFSPTAGSLYAPVPTVSTNATSSVVMEYATTAAASEPSTWFASMPEPLQYVWHRVTMFAWGSATPTAPNLSNLDLPYNATVYTADGWDTTNGGVIDPAEFYYGSRAMKFACDGTEQYAEQPITGMKPGLPYVISGRIKSSGNSGAQIIFTDGAHVAKAETDAIVATQGFGEVDPETGGDLSAVISDVFYPDSTTGFILLRVDGDAPAIAWFDAVKLEQSTVATPWLPPPVGPAVVMDGYGIGIDGTADGTLRLRMSGGDIIEMVEHGLSGGINAAVRIAKQRFFR